MLVLSRRIGEKIMIGDDVTITILGVQGGTVRVGLDAPKEVLILREELVPHDSVQKEKGNA